MTGKTRRPAPRMHPDDMEAVSQRLSDIAEGMSKAMTDEIEKRTRYLREEVERLDRRTRPGELVMPHSVVVRLEERILRLEDEMRDLARSQIKHFLAMDDHEKRMEELAAGRVEELREELTG